VANVSATVRPVKLLMVDPVFAPERLKAMHIVLDHQVR